jgi:hypothetical protein
MKKFYLGALGCLLAMGASAQSFDPVGTVTILDIDLGLTLSIPLEFAFEGKSTPYSSGTFDEDGVKFDVYNKSFGVDRTIKVSGNTSYSRTEIEEREAVMTESEEGRLDWYYFYHSYPEWWVANKCDNATYTDEYVEEWIEYMATQGWDFERLRNPEKKSYNGGSLFVTGYGLTDGFYDENQGEWVEEMYYVAFYFKENSLFRVNYYPERNTITEPDDYNVYIDDYAEFYNRQLVEYTQENIEEYINRAEDIGFDGPYFYDYEIESSEEENGIVTFYTNGRRDDYQNGYWTLQFEWNKETNTIEAICIKHGVSYTGEWVKTIERYDYDEDDFLYDMVIHPVLIGQWDDIDDGFADDGFIATQTLFNNDDKWEFIRPIYKEVIYEDYYYDSEQDRDGDGEIDYKRTRYSDKIVGYQIVSEDGNVLASLDVEENDYCGLAVIMWDEDVYLATIIEKKVESDDEEDYYDRYETYMVLYTIDKNTTNISKINATAPAMRVSPALANRNSTINVTLDGEAATRGGELIITDSNGRTIGRNRVDAGQKSVTMSTDRMSTGAYNITLTEKGKKIDNARIIVK